MREKIHPKYVKAKVTCSCGEVFFTRSTTPEIKIEICSKCHPFYTGKQKFVDSGGRVERFQQKFGKVLEQTEKGQEEPEVKTREEKRKSASAEVSNKNAVPEPVKDKDEEARNDEEPKGREQKPEEKPEAAAEEQTQGETETEEPKNDKSASEDNA